MSNAFTETTMMDLSALDGLGLGADAKDVIIADVATPTNILEDTSVHKALDIDVTKKPEVEKKPEDVPAVVTITEKETADILDTALTEVDASTETQTPEQVAEKEKGRPKTDKNALVSYLFKKVEANEYGIPEDAAFDPKKQTLEQYLTTLPEAELHTLIDANVKAQIDEVRTNTPKEFFDSLPEELQYAAAYVAEGGQDLKGLFKALSHVEEVKQLDPEKESDQVLIAKSYLQATRFGTEEAITEQIEDWKDAGKLEKKAKEYKPALDDMQKQQVEAQLEVAATQRKQQAELAQFYAQHVYKALENNELAGIKLDKKFVKELASNMVYTTPGPYSGKPTNYIGYGLERCQYVEPDFEAVMLAGWILNDKKAALEALGTRAATAQTEKVAKLIKMNQGLGVSEQPAIADSKPVKRIPNTANVLKRA